MCTWQIAVPWELLHMGIAVGVAAHAVGNSCRSPLQVLWRKPWGGYSLYPLSGLLAAGAAWNLGAALQVHERQGCKSDCHAICMGPDKAETAKREVKQIIIIICLFLLCVLPKI